MQLAADRGFWSKENHQLAEDFGVKKIAIENKGKSNYLKGKPFRNASGAPVVPLKPR